MTFARTHPSLSWHECFGAHCVLSDERFASFYKGNWKIRMCTQSPSPKVKSSLFRAFSSVPHSMAAAVKRICEASALREGRPNWSWERVVISASQMFSYLRLRRALWDTRGTAEWGNATRCRWLTSSGINNVSFSFIRRLLGGVLLPLQSCVVWSKQHVDYHSALIGEDELHWRREGPLGNCYRLRLQRIRGSVLGGQPPGIRPTWSYLCKQWLYQ